MMANMVKNVLAKFNYGRLRIDKVLGNFRKHDNNNKSKNKKNSVGGDGTPFGYKRTLSDCDSNYREEGLQHSHAARS